MMFSKQFETARKAAGLTQQQVADRTGIARPNIAAYEAGRREPKISTAHKLLAAVNTQLTITPAPQWHWTQTRRPYAVASQLWDLPTASALAIFETHIHLWWSGPPRTFNLAQRPDRLRAYEIVLREGNPQDITSIIDGTLLCEAWPDLILPDPIRQAWQPAIDNAMQPSAAIKATAA